MEVEEHLYGRQMKPKELGRCKAIKLTFNDPNTTQARSTFTHAHARHYASIKMNFHFLILLQMILNQVIFHARKKLRLQRLKELAAARTADQLLSLRSAEQLGAEGVIPAALVQDLILAYLDTWTQRLA